MTRFLGVAVDPIEGATLLNPQMTGGRIARTSGVSLVLAQSAVPASVTGTTSETVFATIPIPAGAMGLSGALRVTTQWSMTNNANTKTGTIRLGGTTIGFFGNSASASLQHQVNTRARNSMANQVSGAGGSNSFAGSTGTVVATTVDMSAAQNLTITGTLAVSTDTLTLESYTVELLNP